MDCPEVEDQSHGEILLRLGFAVQVAMSGPREEGREYRKDQPKDSD